MASSALSHTDKQTPGFFDVPEGMLNVAATVPCTEAEGPGKRFALWVQGCPLRCPGCCNPHMLEFKEANFRPIEEVAEEILASPDIEGVTFIGGEPFSQAAGLTALAKRLRAADLSVMVFSGFTIERIRKANRPDWESFLEHIDLLVDGPYIQEKLVTDRRWIGSSNQRTHFLTERYAHLSDKEEGWDKGPNTIEIRMVNDQIYINGFPHSDVTKILEALAPKKPRKKKTSGATKA